MNIIIKSGDTGDIHLDGAVLTDTLSGLSVSAGSTFEQNCWVSYCQLSALKLNSSVAIISSCRKMFMIVHQKVKLFLIIYLFVVCKLTLSFIIRARVRATDYYILRLRIHGQL